MPEQETAEQKSAREAQEAEAQRKKDEASRLASQQQSQLGKKIELDPEQYDALLDRLDELEELAQQSKGKGGGKQDSVDDIIDDAHGRGGGQQRQAGQLTAEDIDRMKPSQLVGLILGAVQSDISQPLMVKLEEMRLSQEIREIKGKKGNEDFDDYKEDIFKIASRNPNLSLEEAYRLAKAKRPPKQGDEDDGEERGGGSRRDVLRSLPRRVPRGERPGASQSASRAGEPETRMEAAAQALEEMRKAGKI